MHTVPACFQHVSQAGDKEPDSGRMGLGVKRKLMPKNSKLSVNPSPRTCYSTTLSSTHNVDMTQVWALRMVTAMFKQQGWSIY